MMDKKTGLPKVPANYFWRVSELVGAPYVSLHRLIAQPPRKWWQRQKAVGEVKVGGTFAFPELHRWNAEAAIYSAAEATLERLDIRGRNRDLTAHLMGDYPPKKLVVPSE